MIEKKSGKKPVVISFVSIKGGVGKTHIAILCANCLASAGHRVLVIDTDLNNSMSFHYLEAKEETLQEIKKKNIALAINSEENQLGDYVIKTGKPGVDLIVSSPYLSDLQTISERRLSRMIPTLNGLYDFVIIDCHPTYDGIVRNAINCSDFVMSPVLKDLFSVNAAAFLDEVIRRDTDKYEAWHIIINGYESRYAASKESKQSEYVELFGDYPLTPRETWLPWTSLIHDVIDGGKPLSVKPSKGAVAHDKLYKAVKELSECFCEGELEAGEVF